MKIIKRIMFIISTIYMIWRFFTLPIGVDNISLVFAIVFLIIELIDYIEFMIFYFNVLRVQNKPINIQNKELQNNVDIDIIITTINEPINLIERNIKKCKKIDYKETKKHVYVADDGKREDVKKLCDKYEVKYISRKDNKNAKAGNLNNVLKKTKSPFLLFLDCDMAPNKTILKDMINYFDDENVGFVQAPQSYENPDIYQYKLRLYNTIPSDQNYFFNIHQCSNNNINAVIFCGTNAIARREVLEKIGGFATGVLTEDFATGMLIQNEGYKGIYINKEEAVGYQENNLSGFIKQRSRWQRGCIQTWKKYKLLKLKGLTLSQKAQYWSAINYWLFGIKRLVFLIAPILYSVFKIKLINCSILLFFMMWLPQYLLKRFLIDRLLKNNASSTWNKIYQTILTPIFFITSLKELIGLSKKQFETSTKNFETKEDKKISSKVQTQLFIGHFVLLTVNIFAYFMSLQNIFNNVFDILSLFWSVSNMYYLLIALIFDLSVKDYKISNYKKTNNYSKMSSIKCFANLVKKDV